MSGQPPAAAEAAGPGPDEKNLSKALVAVRVRPKLDAVGETYDLELVRKHDDEHIAALGYSNGIVDPKSDKQFHVDFVFDSNSSQEEVYATCAQELVDTCLKGVNATIFAYGQTGTGKTHTMGELPESTDASNPVTEDSGIIIRALFDIFKFRKSQKSVSIRLFVSYLEIYNEQIRDLLSEKKADNLQIREAGDEVEIVGLTVYEVTRMAQVYDIMRRGARCRSTASTQMNDQSSRSHAVFLLTIEQWHKDEILCSSTLSLVDLAGSERIKKSRVVGDRLKEATAINQSLTALGNVVHAMHSERPHIPYRDSKLTRILKNSFMGNCRTLLIATVAPTAKNYEESLNTLRFANRVKELKPRGRGVQTHELEIQNLVLQRENEELSEEVKLAIEFYGFKTWLDEFTAGDPEWPANLEKTRTRVQRLKAKEAEAKEKEAADKTATAVRKAEAALTKVKNAELEEQKRTLAAEFEGKLASADQERTQLLGQVEVLKGQLAASQGEAERLSAELRKTQAERDRLTAELAASQQSAAKASGEAVSLAAQLATAKDEGARLSAQLSDGSAAVAQMQATTAALEASLAAARAESASLKGELDSKQSDLEQRNADIASLRADLDSLRSNSGAAESAVASVTQEAERLRGDLERARADLSAARTDAKTKHDQLEAAKIAAGISATQLETARNDLARTHDELVNVKDSLSRAKADLSAAEARSAGNAESAAVAAAARASSEEIEQLRRELSALRSDLRQAQGERDEARRSAESLKADNDRLATRLSQAPTVVYASAPSTPTPSAATAAAVAAAAVADVPSTPGTPVAPSTPTTDEARRVRFNVDASAAAAAPPADAAAPTPEEEAAQMDQDNPVDLTERVILYLQSGTHLVKHGRTGKPHERFFFISDDRTRILWKDNERARATKAVMLDNVTECILGQHTEVFKRSKARASVEERANSLSLIFKEEGELRTLDVVAENQTEWEAWVMAMLALLQVPPHFGEDLDYSRRAKFADLSAAEAKICSEVHVSPTDFVAIKARVVSRFRTLGERMIMSIRGPWVESTVDFFRAFKLYEFFVGQGLVENDTLFSWEEQPKRRPSFASLAQSPSRASLRGSVTASTDGEAAAVAAAVAAHELAVAVDGDATIKRVDSDLDDDDDDDDDADDAAAAAAAASAGNNESAGQIEEPTLLAD